MEHTPPVQVRNCNSPPVGSGSGFDFVGAGNNEDDMFNGMNVKNDESVPKSADVQRFC